MPSRRKSVALPQKTVSELSPLHRILEFYLKTLIQPFLIYHGRFYKSINRFLWSFLETYGIPRAVTANAVTYTRTLLTFPTIYLLAKKKYTAAALLVLLNDFGDFLDGVVARWWIHQKKLDAQKSRNSEDSEAITNNQSQGKNDNGDNDNTEASKAAGTIVPQSPSFSTSYSSAAGISHPGMNPTLVVEPSMKTKRLATQYGQYIDAVMDKLYVVPLWLTCLQCGTIDYKRFRWFGLGGWKTSILWTLILTETYSAYIRTKAYHSSSGALIPARVRDSLNLAASSAVKADGVGKAKQTFEMVGSALYLLPLSPLRGLGLTTLTLAVPLAISSVMRKLAKKHVFVNTAWDEISSQRLAMLQYAKALGSKLTVGIVDDRAHTGRATLQERSRMVKRVACVDEVLLGTPGQMSMEILSDHGVDLFLYEPCDERSLSKDVRSSGVAHIYLRQAFTEDEDN